MPTVNLGRIGIVNKGAYIGGTTPYKLNDIVISGGSVYICIQAHSTSHPVTETLYWTLWIDSTDILHKAGAETISGIKTFTAQPVGITKVSVGLSNVDNTTDTLKPVSTAQALAIASAPQNFRNRIINGDMAINQINGGTAVTPTASGYISDQFTPGLSQASKLTFQQVVDAPIGLKFSTKITVAAQYAPLATDYFTLNQSIEGQNITDFALGTSGAVTLNTSQWIKGSIAGTYSVSIRNATVSRSYIGTINVTTAWAKVSITLVGDTTGVWPTDNTTSLNWTIDLGSGTNFNTTANAWQVGNFLRTAGSVTFVNQVVGSTLNITGVQLEKVPTGATVGTDFEFLPADVSMLRCQRYLPSIVSTATTVIATVVGQCLSTSQALIAIPLKVASRIPVTGVVIIGGIGAYNTSTTTGGPTQATAIAYNSAMLDSVSIVVTATSTPLLTGDATVFGTNTTGGRILFVGAQL